MNIPRTWQATLLLVGTIVGVGMFAVPFVFSRAGFLLGAIELALVTAAALTVHLAYAEVVVSTRAVHRLPGYVAHYLGSGVGLISRLSYLFGLSGTLLAYLVLGGAFLGDLLRAAWPALPASAGPAVFYLIGASVIFRSIRFESMVNAVLTLALVAAIGLFSLVLLGSFSLPALAGFVPSEFFRPYGVLIFAMAGAAIIPDMRRLFVQAGLARLPRFVIAGTLAAAVLYLLFAAAVVGVSGPATTPDAIRGLAERFGPAYLLAGSLIGFLATITSFITLGLVFEGMFVADMGFRPRSAWLVSVAIPAGLYAIGLHDFLAIISVVGAVAIGLDSIFILALHRALTRRRERTPEFSIPIPGPVRLALFILFGLGLLYELSSAIGGA